ncbi:MAG: LamG domain-containing protein, partial [Flavipsychrobacter sp.]|nr:LamG domain-containing protein [Flavipsychrobacter sp.]
MNRYFTHLHVFALCFALFSSSFVNAQTLVGSWNFNGNANDGSGHGLNGTVYNATLTSGQAGTANTAYHFNGTSSHIDVPYDSILNLSTFTIQAVVKIDSFNPNTCQAEFIVNRGAQATNTWYNMGIGDNPHDNSCSTYSPNNTEFVDGVSGTATVGVHDGNYITPGVWYCHTVTYDGSKMKLYINGTAIDSVLIASVFNYSNINSIQPILSFGYYPAGGTTFPYWLNGAIDNIKIWNGVLSDAAIGSSCNGNDITINQPFTDTLKCAGGTISVPYTESGSYSSTNTFTLQLSNSSGSFSSPVNIGSVTSTSSGTITGTIPSTTAAGTG